MHMSLFSTKKGDLEKNCTSIAWLGNLLMIINLKEIFICNYLNEIKLKRNKGRKRL